MWVWFYTLTSPPRARVLVIIRGTSPLGTPDPASPRSRRRATAARASTGAGSRCGAQPPPPPPPPSLPRVRSPWGNIKEQCPLLPRLGAVPTTGVRGVRVAVPDRRCFFGFFFQVRDLVKIPATLKPGKYIMGTVTSTLSRFRSRSLSLPPPCAAATGHCQWRAAAAGYRVAPGGGAAVRANPPHNTIQILQSPPGLKIENQQPYPPLFTRLPVRLRGHCSGLVQLRRHHS